VTVAVSLADKLDSIFAFFSIDERPSGSRDPFALRRAALGVISLLTSQGLRLQIWKVARPWLLERSVEKIGGRMATELVDFAAEMSRRFGDAGAELFVSNLDVLSKDIEVEAGSVWLQHLKVTQAFLEFFADRLKVQQREAGVATT
jgi:glycyl-tRNA synthetase beta chain